MISTLAESEVDGERLSDDEIFAFLLLILPAGVETTYRASGNLLVAMLSEPSLLSTYTGVSGIDKARPSAKVDASPMPPCM